MNTVWRTLVSASVIAALATGCGGGSGGGDAPGVTNPPTVTSPYTVVEPQQVILRSVKYQEFKAPKLLSNGNGDLLLAWDDRYAKGGINAMFYHPATGWGPVQQVEPPSPPLIDGRYYDFAAYMDDQGSAIIWGKGRYVFNTSSQAWIKFEFPPDPADMIAEGGLSMDNSSNSVAMKIYFVGLAKSSNGYRYTEVGIKLNRLHEDGTWEEGVATSIMVNGDQPMSACFTDLVGTCVTSLVTASDGSGHLHAMYNLDQNGKRISMWTEAAKWSTPYIIDRTHATQFGVEAFLDVNRNGRGIAIWQHVADVSTPFVRKTAWFDGVGWSPDELFPDNATKIEFVHVDENGATQIIGSESVQAGTSSTSRTVGLRRASTTESWSSVEVSPDGAPADRTDYVYWTGHDRTPFVPLTGDGLINIWSKDYGDPSLKTKIVELRYGSAGWSQPKEIMIFNNNPAFLFARSGNDVVGIKWADVESWESAGKAHDVTAFRLPLN